ncbi:MAG TPA: vitamin K epoxide reductase family protein [Opitutales bacterium]|nr:vitamin K epoxide reductase family protein [Opitutales bacterium]
MNEEGGNAVADREHAAERQFQRFIWTRWLLPLIGLWQLVAPSTFGYAGSAMACSDYLSGALLLVLGLLSLSRRRIWAPWCVFVVGVWLELAPVLLWASASAYLNSSVLGILVIALSVLIPDVPGGVEFRRPGPEIPPGWSYNPSAWVKRMPLVLMSVGGWFASRYLAAYHLGYIDTVWDPFFGEGTRRVLASEVSEAFPVSDAGLGAVAYTFEALFAFLGAKDRWRSNPSTVILFGLLVIPLGVTHLALVTMMPVLVGYWCFFCLFTAALMLMMVPLAIGEIVATASFIRWKVKEGSSFWAIIAKGGGLSGEKADARSPLPNASPKELLPAMAWGISLPGSLAAATALGIWLFFAPAALGITGLMENNLYLIAALTVTVSIVALGEVVRILRYLNVPLGIWIAVSAWLFPGAELGGTFVISLTGILIAVLSLPRGPVRERYGDWEPWIR